MPHLRHLLMAAALLLQGPAARADRSLSLAEAYRLALRNHPSLQVLRDRVRQAEAARYRAWSALKPVANVQGTLQRNDEAIEIDFGDYMPAIPGMPTIAPIVYQKQYQLSFTASATLPLFRGPAYPAIGMARKRVQLARLARVRSQRDFLLQVAQSYFAIVSQGEVVKALEHKVALDQQHLDAARARLTAGQSPRAEALRADLVATQDRQRLRTQRTTLQAARRQLALLLGVAGRVRVSRPSSPCAAPGAVSLSDTLRLRADYRATAVARDLAQQAKRALWWSFLPALDLTGVYHWTQAEGFAGRRGMWYLALNLNLPLYDGGTRYADLRRTKAELSESEHSRAALALQIESQVVKLTADLESARAAVVSAKKALDLARTTASDMAASFEVGAVKQLDLLDANQRLLDAEIGLTTARFQRQLACLTLSHAQGRFDPLPR